MFARYTANLNLSYLNYQIMYIHLTITKHLVIMKVRAQHSNMTRNSLSCHVSVMSCYLARTDTHTRLM
jgi:hypothetical protein